MQHLYSYAKMKKKMLRIYMPKEDKAQHFI